MSKKAPNIQERRTKRKAKTLEYYKQRFRKNFSQLLEEVNIIDFIFSP